MAPFTAAQGQFWFEGQPQFIQAGEFHYFRAHPDQWRHRLGLLQAAGFNTVATYIPWLWHQLEEGVSDFDGHSHPMRNLEGFLDLAAEMGFFIIARPGPYIMAETINEGVPPWVFEKYPQCTFISQDQKTQNVASYLHPDFLGCASRWYQAIFSVLTPRQITRGGRIILIQLDNEMGMIQWVRNILDINPHTLSRFAAYLDNTYGEELPEGYPSTNLTTFLREGITNPQAPFAARIVEDYRRFYRMYLREYATFLETEARANGMDVPPVINIHGFANGGKTFPIGLSQLKEVMRLPGMISATDVYPGYIGEGNFHQILLVNEMTKVLDHPEQPLFSVEFQAGGNQDFGGGQTSLYDLHARLSISVGMRAINHYLFCNGENDPVLSPDKRHDWGHPVRKDGSLRRHYHRYPKLSKVLQAYGADLVRSQPRTVTTIGFLLDDFMTEVNTEATRKATEALTFQRETILFDMIARGLALTHRPFNAVDLQNSDLDIASLPLLWVMMEKQCSAEVQRKLVDYAQKGGKLILAGRICEEDFYHQPCAILKEALEIQQVHTDQPFHWVTINCFNYSDVPVAFLETYEGNFGEVFAASQTGGTVGFIQPLGQGKVMVFGAALPANTLEDLDVVHQMALKMGCQPLFTMSDWLDARLSVGENGSFLFLNNYQDDPVETTIQCDGVPMLGNHVVRLPARSGLILPIDWRLTPEITLHYVTSEVLEKTLDGTGSVLKIAQDEFEAEMTLSGYHCEGATIVEQRDGRTRVRLHGQNGTIVLRGQ